MGGTWIFVQSGKAEPARNAGVLERGEGLQSSEFLTNAGVLSLHRVSSFSFAGGEAGAVEVLMLGPWQLRSLS